MLARFFDAKSERRWDHTPWGVSRRYDGRRVRGHWRSDGGSRRLRRFDDRCGFCHRGDRLNNRGRNRGGMLRFDNGNGRRFCDGDSRGRFMNFGRFGDHDRLGLDLYRLDIVGLGRLIFELLSDRRVGRVRRLDGLHQTRRWQRRLWRWWRRLDFLGDAPLLDHLRGGAFGKDIALGQCHATGASQARHELVRDHLLDRARRTLDLDAMVTLEKRNDFLARGAE
jgi:hypothetical protein